jgi:hypothetical protein
LGPTDELFSVTGHHRNRKLVKGMYLRTDPIQGYYKENGYWKITILTTRLNNEMWTNPLIKNHKSCQELGLIRSRTQHINPGHTYLKVHHRHCLWTRNTNL